MTDEVCIFCFRVTELLDPKPESTVEHCEWPGCYELIWVHPNTFEIARTENGKVVCMAHMEESKRLSQAKGEDTYLVIHPLQAAEHAEQLRALGGLTLEEIDEIEARKHEQ